MLYRVQNLYIVAAVLFATLVWLYCTNASPLVLFLLIIPGVLAATFLVLWCLTTATGLQSYGKYFLLAYIISVGFIEAAAWWSFSRVEPVPQFHSAGQSRGG